MFPPNRRVPDRRRALHCLWLGCALLAFTWLQGAEDGAKRPFNLTTDRAENSLKAFAEQSGRGVIFVTDAVRGVRTNPVQGDFTPGDALGTLLRGTGLVSSHDAKTGAFAVRREAPDESKNVHRAARKSASDRPKIPNHRVAAMTRTTP
jgi:hypothetical protein